MIFYKPCRSKTVFFELNPEGAKSPPATATATASGGAVAVAVALAVAVAVAVAGWEMLPPWDRAQKTSFRTSWDVTGQKFQGLELKLKVFALTFRDLARHLWQQLMRVAR